MPETIDWPPRSRRLPRLAVLVVVAGLLALFGGRALSFYVDNLWFGSLGYAGVFHKMLLLQYGVFLAFAIATFVALYGTFSMLRSAHREDIPGSRAIVLGGQPVQLNVAPLLKPVALIASVLAAFLVASGMTGEWPTFARFLHAPAPTGGITDPIFGKPLNFFLLRLPAYDLLADWLMTVAVLAIAMAVIFLVLTSTTRALDKGRPTFAPVARWRGLSFTVGFFLFALATRIYLSRFEQLLEEHTVFSGVTFVDAHVTLAGLLLTCIALLAGAALAIFFGLTRPSVRGIVLAVVPGVLCFLLVQVLGWFVSSFIVKPNELVKEQPYISHNIEFTRQAYELDKVTLRPFSAQTTVESADAAGNQPTLGNIRLWDWHALQDTLRQIQEIRTYYDFPDIDIDRYQINGQLREVMLAARELSVDKLPESSQNWINERLIYTHGYGLTMNPVNGFTAEGLPTLMLRDMPVQSTVSTLTPTRPEIYFGEMTNSDVYVKTRQKEFNYPQGQSNSLTSYEGKGGIVIGGFLRRILIAFERGDIAKLPFSDDVNDDSRLLMRRNIRERVATLAPFLTFDSDPYIVLGEDGRLSWMLDAFTTSDSYPYSRHYVLGDNLVNYARNSVKVVIDAYDGTTTFYVFDATDPILASYRNTFPELFKDASEMPATLRKHVRYPDHLLTLQAQAYGLYHMTDPEMFYNREDLWTPATEAAVDESGERTTQPMQPNYVLMKLPGEDSGIEFVNILPFTPSNRNNLIGWIAGRSDGANYGKAVVYNFPKTRLVDGPLQVEARIDQNAQLSGQLTLWNQQGSHVRRGNLLVIPTGSALLYAESIYLQADRSPMPELRLVVLALQDRLAYGTTFESAMNALFNNGASSTSAVTGSTDADTAAPVNAPTVPAPTGGFAPAPMQDRATMIHEAAQDLAAYQRLTAEGKLGEAGQKLEQLKRTLDNLNVAPK